MNSKPPKEKNSKTGLWGGGDELQEDHRLVVTKDIELKANWKDVKVNPVKKAINSLFGKNNDGLDISDELVGEAVTNDGEYTGPAHNSVVSSDGKVQIRNFEVFWASTDEDTILDKWNQDSMYSISQKFNHEPKMQINWALSGEFQYSKGSMNIKMPNFASLEDKSVENPVIGYTIKNFPLPKAIFKEDGSLDYNANYGNATFAYYIDKDNNANIVNVQELSPGASGTLTITHGNFKGNHRYIKNGTKAECKPTIELKYKDDILKTFDKSLFIEHHAKGNAYIYKNGELYKEWDTKWGDKPKNSEKYWYVKWTITSKIYDTIAKYKETSLTDTTDKVEVFDKEDRESRKLLTSFIDEHKIVAYYDNESKTYKQIDPVNSYTFNNVFQSQEVKNEKKSDKLYDTTSVFDNFVITRIPIDKLGISKDKNHYITIDNNAHGVFENLTDEKDKINKNNHGYVSDEYKVPVPEAKFTAPPGNMFYLNKMPTTNNNSGAYDELIENYTNPKNLGWNEPSHFWGKLKTLNKIIKPGSDFKKEYEGMNWLISLDSRAANLTYDSQFGDRGSKESYGKKKVKYEIIDDYLYLGNNYKNELSSEDYCIDKIDLDIWFYDYGVYKSEYSPQGKSQYFTKNEDVTVNPTLYLRKESTGKWEKAASFEYTKKGSTGKTKIGKYNAVSKGYKVSKPITYIDGVIVKEIDTMSDNSYYDIPDNTGDKFLNMYGEVSGQFRPYDINKDYSNPLIKVPKGYTSAKIEFEDSSQGISALMYLSGTLNSTEKVKKYIDNSSHDDYVMDITLRNDSTSIIRDESGNIVGIPGTTKHGPNENRTLELDRINIGQEMYHNAAYIKLQQKGIPKPKRYQRLTKKIKDSDNIINDVTKKAFKIPSWVRYTEDVKNNVELNGIKHKDCFHIQTSGTFYDLLPLGVTGVEDVSINGMVNSDYYSGDYYQYKDKNTNSTKLKSSYRLINNWKNSGRIMLVAKFDNAYLDKKYNNPNNKESAYADIDLNYTMIYPWDSYKDYGSKLERNLVAYESGFEKKENGGLDDSLTNDLESGYKDSNPGYEKNSMDGKTDVKLFTEQEIEWMKDLNPDHDEKRFLYAQASTNVSGDTEANIGLTKHIKDERDSSFKLKTKTREGGHYQYKIRLQAAHGTSVSNLVFFDSIENYDPLKADEDYGIKQWRGTLSSIDLNHPIMKGIAPKVYVSTKPKLDIEKHNDVSDSTIWKLYKEGDDLSNVQAVAIDLRKNKDGSDFKLAQDTAINVYLNMKAPWNLKEKQIDPKAKALNAIYASNTVTTSLDNKSTKLIYTAYTAVDLKPVTTETQLKATKKHLDKEGKDIALKGDDFTFELKDAEGKTLQTKTNDNKGNITFDPIKYNSWDVGEYTYKIVEVKGDKDTTAYDGHEEIIKVKVERSGDSELKATITYDKDGAAFNNHEVDAITASLEAKKVYIGKGGLEEKPKAGAFEFILKNAEGKEVAKATNNAEGKVVFEGLEFKPNQIGEHKYTIEEVKGKDPIIEYDNTKKNVTVNVSLTKDFKLKADVVYEGGKAPTFTNTLKSASLQLVKLKDGSDPFILDEVKDKNGFLTSYKVPEAQKDNVLDGAEYELYKLTEGKEELVATLTTKNGISQVVQDIMPGKYKLKETKAPKGYTLNDKDLIFDITDKDAGTIVAKFATDDSIIDMPSTGGQGTKALMIGGSILVAIMAGVLVVANKKKKEELNK